MNSKDYFSQIGDFPHTLSIFLTYTLEKEVIDKIRENSSARTIIIHDLTKGISLSENYNNRLICVPAIITDSYANCFHSKLAILKGSEKIRILIGSMNLTKSSFSSRQEICFQKDLEYDSKQCSEIINILESIKIPKEFNLNFIDELKSININYKIKDTKGLSFIHNTFHSISDRLLEHLLDRDGDKPILKIASPFLSAKLSTNYTELLNKINPVRIELYTRSTNKLPSEFQNSTFPLNLFKPLKNKPRYNFHAKMFLVDYGEEILFYIGSANFTEQGFFKSLNGGGNQECGSLIKTNDPQEIKLIKDWFEKGWEKPQTVETWIPSEEPILTDDNYEEKTFSFAIRENKSVMLFVFIPETTNQQIQIKVDNKKVVAHLRDDDLFFSQLDNIPLNAETLKVQIDEDPEIPVVIFQSEKYNNWKGYYGDSLFSHQSSNIESVIDKELTQAIQKEGITVSSGGEVIIEPPKLEQWYHNVRREINFVRRKNHFNIDHLIELENKLEQQAGGIGIYFVMQYLKAFSAIELKNNLSLSLFREVCHKHLNRCLDELGENKKKFYTFMNRWVNYG